MSDQDPNLDEGLVPGTPETPFHTPRANDAKFHSEHVPFQSREPHLFWDETPTERFLFMCAAFGFTLLIGLMLGYAYGQSFRCY